MAEKSLLIVGGGMAGLAAGCYAQMNGYRSEILEAGRVAGGLCSAWTRKGYTFDTSIHFLAGWKTGALRGVWEELGAVQGREFIVHEEAGRIEAQGKTLVVHRDLDRFEEHLLSFSSADAARIHELTDLARRCTTLDMPVGKPPELLGPIGLARMLFQIRPFLSIWRKYSKLSIQTFAAGFRDPFLREAVRLLGDGTAWPMPDRPLASVAMQLAWEHTGNAGAPVGGSQPLIQAIVRRYEGLGGTISYSSRVRKILVEGGRAIGVRLDDGTERRADAILSAADGRTTLYDWLDGRYLPPAVKKAYETWRVYPPILQVFLGVRRDLSAEPFGVDYPLPKPLVVAGEERTRSGVRHSCFDKTMAPAGKSVVQVWYPTNYTTFEALASDRTRYEAEKKEIAEKTIAELDRRFPGLAADVEVVDVATPLTYRRFTGNWQGSADGWCMTTRNASSRLPLRLPGLSGFYMAGQWTQPFTGTPGAALSARNAIQLLCHSDRQPFVAEAAVAVGAGARGGGSRGKRAA